MLLTAWTWSPEAGLVLGLPGWNSCVTQRNCSHHLHTGAWSGWDAEVEEELCVLSPACLGTELRMLCSQYCFVGEILGSRIGGLRSLGVHDLIQGSATSCVHFSAQHDSLGCTDGLRAQFSRQARTTSPEQAVGPVWG